MKDNFMHSHNAHTEPRRPDETVGGCNPGPVSELPSNQGSTSRSASQPETVTLPGTTPSGHALRSLYELFKLANYVSFEVLNERGFSPYQLARDGLLETVTIGRWGLRFKPTAEFWIQLNAL